MAHAPPVQSGFSEAHLARSPAGESGGGAGRGREQIVVAGATYRRGSAATWRAGVLWRFGPPTRVLGLLADGLGTSAMELRLWRSEAGRGLCAARRARAWLERAAPSGHAGALAAVSLSPGRRNELCAGPWRVGGRYSAFARRSCLSGRRALGSALRPFLRAFRGAFWLDGGASSSSHIGSAWAAIRRRNEPR
jgi:hypothetical protein